MKTLERWLKERPLLLSLLVAAVICWGLGANGVVSEDAMPVGDAEHYVLRGMTLYGFLHTGQWARFWDLFTLPRQSIVPLHYLLFFLLPQGLASMTSYGVTQAVATYGLLAFGLWRMARALDRPEWTPALFLLCAVQNISLDYSFFYYIDVPFMAVGTLALAWQIEAWRGPGWRSGLLSGVGAALLFWVKAPNAIIFTGTYLLAEAIRAVIVWRALATATRPMFWKNLALHSAAVAAGYLPLTLLALVCGGFQAIIKLIDENEVSGLFVTTLECTGLMRLLYFPLCLTFFYHTVMLLLIFGVVGAIAFRLNRAKAGPASESSPTKPFPGPLLLPVVVAYCVLGELFSFGLENKEMRSLLLVLPALWLAFFWALEYARVRIGLTFLAAVAYAGGAFSQVFFNGFDPAIVNSDGYQLKGDWLSRLPQAHPASLAEIELTKGLLRLIHQAMPEGGKVAVGTEQLYVTSESLTWCLEHDLALRGEQVPSAFNNFLTVKGEFCRRSLLDARGILVIVHPSLQYSREVYQATGALLKFVNDTWYKDGTAGVFPLESEGSGTIGLLIVMKQPITDAQIDQLLRATNSTELPANVVFSPPADPRLSWPEMLDILKRWQAKRLGW